MRFFLMAWSLALIALACKNPEDQKTNIKSDEAMYPKTKKDTTVIDDYFGTKVTDPYRWLENDTSAETAAWVREENEVTRNYLDQIPFRSAIRQRYEELFNYEKYSAPFKKGDFTYYYLNTGLQNQSVLYREQKGEAEAQVFLDPNRFSKDGTTSLAGISFSKDGSLAGYQISEGGSDWRKVIILQSADIKQIGDTLVDVKFSDISWKGNDGFYYSSYEKVTGSQLSAKTQEHRLLYHKLGTAQTEDKLIFGGSKTPRRYIGGQVSENQQWLIITAANETYGNELYVQDLTKPDAPIVPVVSDMKSSNDILDVDDNYFYIQTDRDAPNSKIVKAPLTTPGTDHWTVLIPTTAEPLSTSTAGGYFFCHYLKDAISKVYQYDHQGKRIREILLPGPGTAMGFNARAEDKEVYYMFSSYVQPSTIYRMDIASGKTELYKQPAVKFNPQNYESRQVFYTSKDGTKIPMIITFKKGTKLDGKNPTLLYGYGGFNVSLTPYFSTSRLILLENGGIYAVANLRGGGEYGAAWHQQGIKTKKQNVFDDFISAAHYLIDSGYTSSEYLAIEGGSNGGLLVGASMLQEPKLFKVAFPAVGVLDMLRYHKFTAGAGWAYDYGTSEESKEMFDYLYKYSPLHNIKPGEYPATLITTADHDDRVVPAHSFKFAATLQENQKGKEPVLIRIETKAGHGAGKSTEQILEENTDMWSFFFYNMGITPYQVKNKLN